MTTGMVTKEWAAIHRKHHAKCETAEDPHSPQQVGINRVLWGGVFLYVKESYNRETMTRYGHGTPDDWLERNVYSRFSILGITPDGRADVMLFGVVPGALILITQIAGFRSGRRASSTESATSGDTATGRPRREHEHRSLGIIIGGEELHNNHHAYATSAKLSNKWYEIDLGWMYICLLEALGLAQVKKVAPTPRFTEANPRWIRDARRNVRYDVLSRIHRGFRLGETRRRRDLLHLCEAERLEQANVHPAQVDLVPLIGSFAEVA